MGISVVFQFSVSCSVGRFATSLLVPDDTPSAIQPVSESGPSCRPETSIVCAGTGHKHTSINVISYHLYYVSDYNKVFEIDNGWASGAPIVCGSIPGRFLCRKGDQLPLLIYSLPGLLVSRQAYVLLNCGR